MQVQSVSTTKHTSTTPRIAASSNAPTYLDGQVAHDIGEERIEAVQNLLLVGIAAASNMHASHKIASVLRPKVLFVDFQYSFDGARFAQ
jgi:hypothetical protein